jgi:hypothetical protein
LDTTHTQGEGKENNKAGCRIQTVGAKRSWAAEGKVQTYYTLRVSEQAIKHNPSVHDDDKCVVMRSGWSSEIGILVDETQFGCIFGYFYCCFTYIVLVFFELLDYRPVLIVGQVNCRISRIPTEYV